MSKKKKNPKKRKRIGSVENFATSIPNQLRKARSYPIKSCYISDDWREMGMANILVLREKPNGRYVVGGYLIDLYCLGLKDTFFAPDMSSAELELDLFKSRGENFIPIDEDKAHSIIYGAMDYAGEIGFFPHRDFKKTKYVLKTRDEIEFDDTVEFGKDGKPFFVAGPNDNEQDVDRILEILEKYENENSDEFDSD